jgi:mRNA interferase MazF
MACKKGDVVLVPFPYRDRLAEKTRPAVVVSNELLLPSGDIMVAAITSHPSRFATDVELTDWKTAGLQLPSTVRMLVGTMSEDRVVLKIGQLSATDQARLQTTLMSVIS